MYNNYTTVELMSSSSIKHANTKEIISVESVIHAKYTPLTFLGYTVSSN